MEKKARGGITDAFFVDGRALDELIDFLHTLRLVINWEAGKKVQHSAFKCAPIIFSISFTSFPIGSTALASQMLRTNWLMRGGAYFEVGQMKSHRRLLSFFYSTR